jgi:triacylglycerol lipase
MYRALETVGLETGAFSQLTRRYMQEDFNPRTPDREGVRLVTQESPVVSPGH